jgi:hypothetical protein
VDLSPDGMRVELRDVDIEIGERLFCFRTKPDGRWFFTDAFRGPLAFREKSRGEGRSLGPRFGSLSATSRRCVKDELRGVPPLLPQGAQRIGYARAHPRTSCVFVTKRRNSSVSAGGCVRPRRPRDEAALPSLRNEKADP